MDDPHAGRKAATNWREYISQMHESIRVGQWAWREFVNAKARHHLKRMMIAFALGSVAINAIFWIAKFTADGLAKRDGIMVVCSLTAMAACFAAYTVFDHLQMKQRELAQGENLAVLKRRMNELFFEKSLGQHLQESGALNTANIERGKGRIDQLENMLMFDGIPSLLALAVSFVMLSAQSPMAGAIMFGLLCSYLIWTVYLNRRIGEECVPLDRAFRKINRWQHERWDRVERVKTCAKEAQEIHYQDTAFRDALGKERTFWFWFIGKVTWRGITNRLVLLGVIAYGVWRIWECDWTAVTFIPFLMYASRVSENVWRIGAIEHQINWNMPAIRTAMRALTTPSDITDAVDAVVIGPNEPIGVAFEDVSFRYDRKTGEDSAEGKTPEKVIRPVLEHIGFTIEPGEKVALIGPSGAGKTSIMRLLMRYMDPHAGIIRVNGHDLTRVQLASWLGAIAYIPQQAMVFDGTVRSNLLYQFPGEEVCVSDEELWDVMRRLRIDFGDRLTDGLDTKVGRHGIELSGGEQQRLMIGAAALRRPRFMVIDEATASLDATTEREVQEGLEQVLGSDIGALIITHRLNTARRLCSKFIVLTKSDERALHESQIEAIAGSFEDLAASSPTFRRLAEDQGIVLTKAREFERPHAFINA